MQKIFIPVFILLMGILTGCGSSVRVFHDLDPKADFNKYNTFNFLPWTEGNVKSINEMERERMRIAVKNELENRGLKFVAGKADISVQITIYHREKNDLVPTYNPYYYPYYSPYYYGPPRVYNYMERAVAIDIYDNSSQKHVWHSAAIGELENDSARRAKLMPDLAHKILKDFPRQKTG